VRDEDGSILISNDGLRLAPPVEFAVEDDGVLTIPRSATMTSQRAAGQWPEFVCAEKIRAYYYRKDLRLAAAVSAKLLRTPRADAKASSAAGGAALHGTGGGGDGGGDDRDGDSGSAGDGWGDRGGGGGGDGGDGGGRGGGGGIGGIVRAARGRMRQRERWLA
jgi:hypothetical protein